MKMKRIVLGLVFLAFMGSCGDSEWDRQRFSVQDGSLYRRDRVFEFKAIEMPALTDPDMPLDEKVKQLNEICAVGGNSVVVNLDGASPDGMAIRPDWLEAFQELTTETRWRQMGVLLRIFPEGHKLDRTAALKLINTVSAVFQKRWDLVYWIEGPDQAGTTELVGEFKKVNRDLTVAAESGGDIVLVAGSARGGSQPYLADGSVPASEAAVGFFLPDSPESYQVLESTIPGHGASTEASNEGLSAKERDAGFVPLFDGVSFAGWMATEDPKLWRINDGVIEWVEDGGGYLRSLERYDNFVLRLEFKISDEGNSGIFIRAPMGGRWSRIGMEIQVHGDYGVEPHKNGTASVYDVIPPQINASRPAGEWNEIEIACDGPSLKVTLNGELVQDVNLDDNPILRLRLRKGFIALQDHGDPVWYRNIRIKEL